VIRKDDLGTVADEKIAIDLHSSVAQSLDFLKKSEGIEDNTVADHSAAARPENAAGDQLEDELTTGDGDRMAGIMSASISRYDIKILGKVIDDLSLSFVAPLGAHNDGGFAPIQSVSLAWTAMSSRNLFADSTHSLPACVLAHLFREMANEGCNTRFYLGERYTAIEGVSWMDGFFRFAFSLTPEES
jgi:hypothetical protein